MLSGHTYMVDADSPHPTTSTSLLYIVHIYLNSGTPESQSPFKESHFLLYAMPKLIALPLLPHLNAQMLKCLLINDKCICCADDLLMFPFVWVPVH